MLLDVGIAARLADVTMEVHVLLDGSRLPDRHTWQAALDTAGFPTRLDPEMQPERDSGLSPATYEGRPAGFEIQVGDSSRIIDAYPELRDGGITADTCVSFTWSTSLDDLAAAVTAAAVLANLSGGTYFDPQEGDVLSGPNAVLMAADLVGTL